jgi:hypothetical protein
MNEGKGKKVGRQKSGEKERRWMAEDYAQTVEKLNRDEVDLLKSVE